MLPRAIAPELQTILDRIVQGIQTRGWGTATLMLQDNAAPLPPDTDQQADDVLAFPLQVGDQKFGWLVVDPPADEQPPTPSHIRTLEAFAEQAALTIQQARLHHQQQQQAMRQTILNDIAHSISQHLDMSDLFGAIVNQLARIVDFRRVSITLRQGTNRALQVFIQDTVRHYDTPTPLEKLALTHIIQQNQPKVVVHDLAGAERDLTADERRLLEDGICTYSCFPLLMWGQVLGAFSLAGETPDAFSPEDIDLLQQLGDHLAGAVWNALLHELEQKRRQTSDALTRLSKIINSTLELDEVLSLTLEQLERAIPFDTASILLLDQQKLTIAACRGFAHPEQVIGSSFRIDENNISHQTLLHQETRIEPDVQQLPEWGHHRDDIEGTHMIRSWIGSPLVMRGESIGLLVMDKFEPDFFTDEDGETTDAFADQIAIAIHNARLYASELRKRQSADALANLSKLVNSTLELDTVLELALQQLEHVISYDSATIMLQDGSHLVIAACQGFSQPDELLGSVITADEVNLGYKVLQQQQIRVVADVQQEPDWGTYRDHLDDMRAIRSWIGVPLRVRGQNIGILTIDKHEPGFFSEEDGEMANAFAAQIATAIQNARLYQITQEQRDKLSAILNDITDSMIVLDNNDCLWLLNPAAEQRLGIRREEVFGQPITALELPELSAAYREAQQANDAQTTELVLPDGTTFNASLAPVHDVGWVIVMQDITSLKELDRLRTEWVAGVSHDLKNPIQLIQLGATLLEMDGPLNESQRERIAIIQRSTEQLSALVAGVLDLARLEAGPSLKLAELNPLELLSAAVYETEHLAAKKQQQLASDLPADLPLIIGDRGLLQRAVVNLLSNAIKYTPVGGTITLQAAAHASTLQVHVVDNGQGIPADALPHLFDRFYRVPGSAAEGSGLGLSIVKSIVEKHSGRIDVESTPGEGSTFSIILPLAAATPESGR